MKLLDGINGKDLDTIINLSNKLKGRNKRFVEDTIIPNITTHLWDIPQKVLIPKDGGGEREVFIYNEVDSFILKYINEKVSDVYDSTLPANLFSYRKGVTTLNAMKYVKANAKGMHGVKMDIKSYFSEVSQDIIINSLRVLFKDQEEYELMERFYTDTRFKDVDGEIKNTFLSLKPGNAFSAFLSNYVLKDIDNKITGIVDVYSRYSDDIIIFCNSKQKLDDATVILKEGLGKLGLKIKDTKTEYFQPNEPLNYLGLKTDWKTIDISDNRFNKIKREIKIECRKYRRMVSKGEIQPIEGVKKAITWYNKRLYTVPPFIKDNYSWATSTFSNINTISTLREIDFYFINTVRWVYTGKNNKSNTIKLPTKRLRELGVVSLVEMYNKYREYRDIFPEFASLVVNKGEVGIDDI